ncbi:MAG: NAD(P)H-dependent oxidoreductase subunit E [Geodermatophilaceae bacterium]|nr:NAD(P)H-dependent oxidoreductase subunit E [Geodermatophilaceae bacterium]
MDLRLSSATATDAERSAVDALLGLPDTRWEGGDREDAADARIARTGAVQRARRTELLPVLHAVQKAIGWVSWGALNYVSLRLTVPPAEAYGVASFYAMLSTEPQAGRVIHVCDDVACRIAGAGAITDALRTQLGEHPSPSGACTFLDSPCLGLCERAPAVLVQRTGLDADLAIAPASPGHVPGLLAAGLSAPDYPEPVESIPQAAGPDRDKLRLLRRIGVVDPTSLAAYREAGGYAALDRAMDIGTQALRDEVTASKLMGRGGAAFPTGRKWSAVAEQSAQPHYLVCNADESEPGTFKDRVLMEGDPFALIEAMTIAAYATGCSYGYLYIRGEYPLATARLAAAIHQVREAGLLGGTDILGRGFCFDIELRRGAGAYICGEETALINSIEGFRGEPRNKPPFPVAVGLFAKPTVINNVETLLNVLDIVVDGGESYAAVGTPDSTGTKLFCLSGYVKMPGVYEVPFGATLRELLDLAGGITGSKRLQAIMLGGAAGTFVTEDALDTSLTFEGTREIGASLGSGVIFVLDDTVDLLDTLTRIAAFFRDESCGQCVPCRVGTVRQEEALVRLGRPSANGARGDDKALLADLAGVMSNASICGLGHTAATALSSALKAGLLDNAFQRADAVRTGAAGAKSATTSAEEER